MQTSQKAPSEPTLAELYALVTRFQNLKQITGTSKSTSYNLNFNFDPWSDTVDVNWGCHDVGDYPRHYCTTTTRENLLTHLADELEKMEKVVAADS